MALFNKLAPLAPLAPLVPLGGANSASFAPTRRRRLKKKPPPALTPEEEDSILGGVMGGLRYAGEMLDKPGRAARGTIGGITDILQGDPTPDFGGGLLNLVPFSDTMGLTDPKTSIGGRDLLENWGAPENKPGLFNSPEDALWDVAGFATEVGTDPLIWLTGPLGTLSKQGAAKVAGTGAKKLASKGDDVLKLVKNVVEGTPAKGSEVFSKIPVDIAEQFRRGDRAVAGLRIPLIGKQLATFGSGETARGLAAKGVESLFYKGKYNPVPLARGFLSPTAGGSYTAETSLLADTVAMQKSQAQNQFMNVMPALDKGARDIEQTFVDMAKAAEAQGDTAAFNDFTRRLLEEKTGLQSAEEMEAGLRSFMLSENSTAVLKGSEELAGELHKQLDAYQQLTTHVHSRIRELGGDIGVLQDTYIPHFPRRPGDPRSLDPGIAKRQGGFYDWAQSRKEFARNWPGGTAGINAVARDPLITATAAPRRLKPGVAGSTKARKKVAGVVRQSQDDALEAELRKSLDGMGVKADKKASLRDVQKTYLWNRHARRPFEEAADAGLLDQIGLDRTVEQLKAVGTEASLAEAEKLAVEGLTDANRTLYREVGRETEMKRFFDDGALDRMLNYFRKAPEEVLEKGLFDRRPVEDMFDYYRSMLEKEATLTTAHNYLRGTQQSPVVFRGGESAAEGGVPLVEAWKDAGFKRRGLNTFARDQFGDIADDRIDDVVDDLVIRNGGQNVLRNLNESMKPKVQGEVGEWLDKINSLYKANLTIPFPQFHARNLMSSTWANWASGELPLPALLKETARSFKFALTGKGELEYLDEMAQLGLMKARVTRQAEVGRDAVTAAGGSLEKMLGPGLKKGVADTGFLDLIKPWNVRGVTEKRNILQQGGEKVYAAVEFAARATPYRMFRKQGLDPAEAYRRVMRMQFDYSDLAPFEREVMQKALFFYTWTRKSIPYTLSKLLERPGGKTAQTIRLLSQQPAEGEYRPAWLREGMALRMPGGTPEATSYLKQGGLPVEDLNLVTWKDGLPDWGRTAKKAASMLNPLLTFGPEQFAGEKLFSGQKIKNARSTTEALTRPFGVPTEVPWIDKYLPYSPLSRVGTELSKVVDYEGFEGGRKPAVQVGLNLFSGLKFTTQDAELQKQRDLQAAYQEDLLADPYSREGSHFYTPRRFKGTEEAAPAEELIRRERQAAEVLRWLYESRDAKKKETE